MNELGEPMQAVCSEDQIQMTDAIQQPLALLLGNTPAYPDDQMAFLLLELPQPSESTIHLMFWLGPDATGVEQDNVSLMDIFSGPIIVLC